MEFIKIIFISVLGAILYGLVHDIITAQISVEYFTIGHPKVIESNSPIMLAIVWGIIATWWAGLIIGIFLAISARIGSYPKISARQVFPLIVKLLLLMGASAIIAGITGFILAKSEAIYLIDYFAERIPENRHHLFLTAGWTHVASYLAGFVGGIVLCILIVRKRKILKYQPLLSSYQSRSF